MFTVYSKLRKLYLKSKLEGVNYPDTDKFGIMGYAPHKTASMFMFKLFKDLANEKKILFYSDNNSPSNIRDFTPEIADSFCMAPIRYLIKISDDFPNIKRIKKIVQIRDPRDMIVSEYYSFGFSHTNNSWSEEKKKAREIISQMSIDDYVLSILDEKNQAYRLAGYSLQERFLVFLPELAEDALIVKYEDMILNYSHWLKSIIDAFEFGAFSNIANQYYFLKYKDEFKIPKKENIYSHKRAVKPGNYRDKLKPQTINQLNQVFAEFLNKYGYNL